MSPEVFCPACDDEGVRFCHEREMEFVCDDCPRCPCGERFAAHDVLCAEGDVRPLEPKDVLWVMGEAWAGECYEAYLDEMDEPQPLLLRVAGGML